MYTKITSIYFNNIKKEENKNLCLKIILWTMELKKQRKKIVYNTFSTMLAQ